MIIPITDSLLTCYIFDKTRNLESSELYINISPNLKPSDSLIILFGKICFLSFLKNGSLKISGIIDKLFIYLSNNNPIIFRNVLNNYRRIQTMFRFIDNIFIYIDQRNDTANLNALQTVNTFNRIIRSD